MTDRPNISQGCSSTQTRQILFSLINAQAVLVFHLVHRFEHTPERDRDSSVACRSREMRFSWSVGTGPSSACTQSVQQGHDEQTSPQQRSVSSPATPSHETPYYHLAGQAGESCRGRFAWIRAPCGWCCPESPHLYGRRQNDHREPHLL